MSQQFKDFMGFIIFTLFFIGLFSLAGVFMYFIDDYLMSAKKAIICACTGIFVLIVSTVISYWVWG